MQGAYSTTGSLDGQKARFIIDTAGDYGLLMPDGSTDPFTRVMLGDMPLMNVQPEQANAKWSLAESPYPRIGRKILERFTVVFDNDKNKIYFERPKAR